MEVRKCLFLIITVYTKFFSFLSLCVYNFFKKTTKIYFFITKFNLFFPYKKYENFFLFYKTIYTK